MPKISLHKQMTGICKTSTQNKAKRAPKTEKINLPQRNSTNLFIALHPSLKLHIHTPSFS
jgi:hypothetical protein